MNMKQAVHRLDIIEIYTLFLSKNLHNYGDSHIVMYFLFKNKQ